MNDHFQLEDVIVGLMAPVAALAGTEERNGGDAGGAGHVDVGQAPEEEEEADAGELGERADAVDLAVPVPVGELVESAVAPPAAPGTREGV